MGCVYKMKPDFRLKAGFTMTEVMIASAILALVCGGFIYSFMQATRLQYMADVYYASLTIARNRIEDAKIYAYGSLSMLGEVNTRVNRNGASASDGTFLRTTTVGVASVNSNCTEVTVEVWYEGRPGVTSPVPLEVNILIGD